MTDHRESTETTEEIPALLEEEWRPVPRPLSLVAAPSPLPTKKAQIWALTLAARQIPYRLEQEERGWQLLVPVDSFPAALEELRHFEDKNRNWPPPLPPAAPQTENLTITLSVLLLLAIFHNLTRLHLPTLPLAAIDWIAAGNADAGAIQDGQWWRTITALTLHSDGLHLLGNLTIGGLFIVLLCRTLGSGLAWSLLLLSGSFGNLLNAWLQSPQHRSVGASTAVFAAVGLLAALALFPDHQPRRRWPLPLAAALALLALLGSEGANTDLGAHFFGFGVGIILGLLTGPLLRRYGRPGPRFNALLALADLGMVATAWWLALRSF